MDAKLSTLVSKILGMLVILTIALAAVVATPVAAQSFQPTQEACKALAEKFANVAQPDDPQWVSCFTAGWVNWVFSETEPLPSEPPMMVQDAITKGALVQVTEPWRGGCDNTLKHPDCSIGFLKAFPTWENATTFLKIGEFIQAGIVKKGPWTRGSLWMTNGFIQVMEGKELSQNQVEAFCSGNMFLAFALDGEYVIPKDDPCAGQANNVYFVRERWNGGCVGDQLPDSACNVGEVMKVNTWKEVHDALDGAGWNRGSIAANHKLLMEMMGVKIATATQVASTATPLPSPTAASTATPATPTTAPKGAATTGEIPWWTWGCLLPLVVVALLVVIFRRPIRERIRALDDVFL